MNIKNNFNIYFNQILKKNNLMTFINNYKIQTHVNSYL
jgi:hypothetical protein